jgi:PAS domain S-box-containing protein
MASVDMATERYRLLVESSPLVPWEADAQTWQFTYVGPQAEDLLGYPVEAWYTDGFWAERVHDDDRAETLATCQELSAKGGHYEFEYRMIRADGQIIWIHDVVSVEMQDGVPALLRGYLIDVTARKDAEAALARSERRMAVMADALPVVISYIGSDFRYRFSNLAHQRFHGLPRESIIDQFIWDVIGQETYDAVRDRIEAALSGQQITFEKEVPHKAGLLHVHASYVPHFDIDGSVLGMYALIQDVTERVHAEEESRRHRAELAHVARVATLGELTASFAHQLSQPLAAIVSNAQAARRYLGREQPDYHELQGALVDIADDGLRAGEVIRRIRSLLKKGDLARTPLHINGVIQDVLGLVDRDLISMNVIIRTDLAPDLPVLLGDRIQLQQVVLNLTLNALEAMEDQNDAPCEIVFQTALIDLNHICVSVQDSGKGLAPDEQDRIFEAFYTTKAEGLGMGLSINRTIVEAHGGRLWGASNPDRGATFSFTLSIGEQQAD